jgi:leucyl-tRNA synthetase
VTKAIEDFHFNRAVALMYEFVNTLAAVKPSPDMGAVMREAMDALVVMLSPMMPHLAEELWQALGRDGLVAHAAWPQADPALLVEDTVTIAVQVQGKLRDTLTVPKDMAKEALEREALASDKIQRILEGQTVKKVIVVPNRIVNIVV